MLRNEKEFESNMKIWFRIPERDTCSIVSILLRLGLGVL